LKSIANGAALHILKSQRCGCTTAQTALRSTGAELVKNRKNPGPGIPECACRPSLNALVAAVTVSNSRMSIHGCISAASKCLRHTTFSGVTVLPPIRRYAPGGVSGIGIRMAVRRSSRRRTLSRSEASGLPLSINLCMFSSDDGASSAVAAAAHKDSRIIRERSMAPFADYQEFLSRIRCTASRLGPIHLVWMASGCED